MNATTRAIHDSPPTKPARHADRAAAAQRRPKAEVLVRPLATANSYLQQRFQTVLLDADNFDTVPIHAQTCRAAADLRARYRLGLGDARQPASTIEQGCEAFLTNALRPKRVSELRILVLDELEP